jgi:hypothetical protein
VRIDTPLPVPAESLAAIRKAFETRRFGGLGPRRRVTDVRLGTNREGTDATRGACFGVSVSVDGAARRIGERLWTRLAVHQLDAAARRAAPAPSLPEVPHIDCADLHALARLTPKGISEAAQEAAEATRHAATWRAYCSSMARPGTYGTEAEQVALAFALGRRLRIWVRGDSDATRDKYTTFCVYGPQGAETLHIRLKAKSANDAENHFEALEDPRHRLDTWAARQKPVPRRIVTRRVRPVPEDGNCLFGAVARLLEPPRGSNEPSSAYARRLRRCAAGLRCTAVAWLRTHGLTHEFFGGLSVADVALSQWDGAVTALDGAHRPAGGGGLGVRDGHELADLGVEGEHVA